MDFSENHIVLGASLESFCVAEFLLFLLVVNYLVSNSKYVFFFSFLLGIIGDWKNYFTDDQNIAFSKLYNEKMQNSNLELIFDPEEIDNRNNNGEVISTTPTMKKSKYILNGNVNNKTEHAT